MSNLESFESKLGYGFQNQKLLRQALTHRSVGSPNNERLEYLGDSILGFVVAEFLYHRFIKLSEGDLTKMRARLVRQNTLATLARELGIQNQLLLGGGELKSGGQNRDSILSGAFEATIAAIYIDGGLESVKIVLDHLYHDLLETIQPADLKDSKTQLQEALQKKNLALPEYTVVDQSGMSHNLIFTVICRVKGLDNALTAKGSSRKAAEQLVASKALKVLTQLWAVK